jgi:integrase
MKVQGRGQAKVFTPEEKELLFTKGFLCSRDRALNGLCYYTACRASEARQVRRDDLFDGDSVRKTILLRKSTTKAKQATREIPTHPKLATFLTEYICDARELFSIKQVIGSWDFLSLTYSQNPRQSKQIFCPKCHSNQSVKRDYYCHDEQAQKSMRQCQDCNYCFFEKTTLGSHPELQQAIIRLGVYSSHTYGFLFLNPKNPFLFPGLQGNSCIGFEPMLQLFKKACKRVGITGASTHSWRRTALTEMYKRSIPLRTIQKISGHQSLAALQRYLEVSREQVEDAVLAIPHLTTENLKEIYKC